MKGRRALALVVALFFEVLLFMLVLSFFKLVPVELTSARRDHVRAQSFYYSKALANQVIAWLCYAEESSGNPLLHLQGESSGESDWPRRYSIQAGNVEGFKDWIFAPDGQADPDWSAEISLFPDEKTEAGLGPHTFKLLVRSRFSQQPITSHEFLLVQQTFAKYGFFVDRPPSSGYYTAYKDDVYEGEFHINGKLPLYVDSRLFSEFKEPVFRGQLTFTQSQAGNPWDGINYVSGSSRPFDSLGNVIIDSDGIDRYSKLCSAGRSAIRLEGDVAMPRTDTSSELPLAKAAWFGRNAATESLASANVPDGLTLRRTEEGSLGGIYYRGDVRDMVLEVLGQDQNPLGRNAEGRIDSGHPQIRFRAENQAGQNIFTRVVEVRDPQIPFQVPGQARLSLEGGTPSLTGSSFPVNPGSTVVVRDPGTPGNSFPQPLYEVYQGMPNGVVFVDGNVGRVPNLNQEQAGGAIVNRDYCRNTVSSNASDGGLSGINYGAARTIGVNLARNRYLRIRGDLTRGDAAPGSIPEGRRDGLGLVAYDIVVGGEIPRQGDTRPFYLYSLVFAGRRDLNEVTQPGSVIYENWDTVTGWGRLFSVGSYVVGNDRLWGSTTRGWRPTFRHDARLAHAPPPFYPTRGDYRIEAYREVLR